MGAVDQELLERVWQHRGARRVARRRRPNGLAHLTLIEGGRPGTRSLQTWAGLSGLLCVTAWAVGLALAPPAPHAGASAATVNFFYAAHHASAFRQAYLVDGVAAAAFVVFVVTVSRAMASPGRRAASMPSVVVFTSIGLATASFILVGLFAWLDHRVGGGARNVASALTAVRAIDALRLVLLAALVALASTVVRHSPAVSLQIQRLGVLAAVFLAVGALDYVAGGPVFLATHAVALLALLMWTATLSFSMLRQQP